MISQNANNGADAQDISFARQLFLSIVGALLVTVVLTAKDVLLMLVGSPLALDWAERTPSSLLEGVVLAWLLAIFAFVAWFRFRKNSWRQVFQKASPIAFGVAVTLLLYNLIIVLFLR